LTFLVSDNFMLDMKMDDVNNEIDPADKSHNNMKTITACHLMFDHDPLDGRIYHKECLSLAQAGFSLWIMAPSVSKSTIGKKGQLDISATVLHEQPNIRYISYPWPKWLPKWFGIRRSVAKSNILKQLLRLRPDILHAHEHGLVMEIAAKAKTYLPDLKVIMDFHESYLHILRQKRHGGTLLLQYLRLEDKLLKAVDGIITVSDFLSGYYGTLTDKPILTIPNSQSRRLFTPQKTPALDGSLFWLVLEGRWLFDRGLKVVLEAMVLMKHEQVGVLVIGDLPEVERDYFDQFCRINQLQTKFHITTMLPYLQVPDWLQLGKAGLCIYHSLNARTGYPNKLFNYLCFQLPVIANRESASGQFVEQTGAGLTFEQNDARALADIILKLMRDKILYDELREKAEQAFAIWNWENGAEKLIGLYRQLTDLQ